MVWGSRRGHHPLTHIHPATLTHIHITSCAQEPTLLDNVNNYRSRVADLSNDIEYFKTHVSVAPFPGPGTALILIVLLHCTVLLYLLQNDSLQNFNDW